jgi:hypothetical protein
MELNRIGSAPGTPQPADMFEPHLPPVEVLEDPSVIFAMAREQSERGAGGNGHREVVIVTPGRILMGMPTAPPGTMPESATKAARSLLGDAPLKVTVIAFNRLDALMEDRERTKVIPFLGHLLAFVYVGHTVVAFEGHPTAFEAGVRGTDVLLIDSAMLPFLQPDWAEVAFRVMNDGRRVFVHDRKSFQLRWVARSPREPGWVYTEPDGEASYTNSLLTTLAQGTATSVRLVAGQPVPALAPLTKDSELLEWISTLPFRFDRLNAETVMAGIVRLAKPEKAGLFRTNLVMRAKLARKGGAVDVAFRLTEGREGGRRTLLIERM